MPPAGGPLRIIISGAPASGKGTQCEEIVEKYGVVHISTGDLLRAEVKNGTPTGEKAKGYMDQGLLVPDEVITTMVLTRLSEPDAQENGWLLDGYPRTADQVDQLNKAGVRPDIFILLEVPDDVLVERVVGRRLDPITGKIYHLKFNPPPNEEVAARLTQRSDDTEEKVKTRLHAYEENLQAIVNKYSAVAKTIQGNRPKDEVTAEIMALLEEIRKEHEAVPVPVKAGKRSPLLEWLACCTNAQTAPAHC